MSAGTRLPGTPDPGRHFLAYQGLRLAADQWGPPEGRAVILQHGGGQTRHAWRGTGEVLGEAGFHAIAYDARGHGDSDWSPSGDYSQDSMVCDLQEIVRALGDASPVLVGASMGGGTSLVAAGEHVVDASALVLVDVAPRIEPAGVANIQAFMTRNPDGFGTLDEVADAIASYQPHRQRPTSLKGLAKNVRLAPDGRYRWHWDPRLFVERKFDLSAREERLRACARALQIPSLLVRGGMSDVLSDEGVRDFLEAAPRAEYLNIANAGHMVAGDRNDMFGKAVVEFLTRPGLLGPRTDPASRAALLQRLGAGDLNDIP
ncbi:MAG: alpha/beta hydrolase fold protein [Frankiales bacterium]|nr:alpha/beta hydrolase fold protein [Frankiales bacterium]